MLSIGAIAAKVFGTSNDRKLKPYRPTVEAINALEPELERLSDAELRARTEDFRKQLADGADLEDLLVPAFATVREAAKRTLGQRHFDVQLIGGMVLHQGRISEMKTGEGKTLVATLPVYLNALAGQGVHVVTVNDYLAKRDSEWMGRLYKFLGLTVGVIVHDLDDEERKASYNCDITYGTNNEYGFDYLRDNMKFRIDDCVQRGHNYAIVDEVDSILIDEARTPLIISGPSEESTDKYYKINRIIPRLHQAVEAKEGVKIERENQTLATITFQNYFRMYKKLAGMTGTAETEAAEFGKTYKLDVIVIPTHMPMVRKDAIDMVYRTEEEKFRNAAKEIKERHDLGQPVLVGTISVEKSERLSSILKKMGVRHEVLNAKNHEREAFIVAQAGRKNQVAVSTNMAGRGTDILLGGNPDFLTRERLRKDNKDPDAVPK